MAFRQDIDETLKDQAIKSKFLLTDVLRLCMETEITVERIRQHVERHLTVSLRAVFNELDWLKRGYLTASELERYFETQAVSMKKADNHDN